MRLEDLEHVGSIRSVDHDQPTHGTGDPSLRVGRVRLVLEDDWIAGDALVDEQEAGLLDM